MVNPGSETTAVATATLKEPFAQEVTFYTYNGNIDLLWYHGVQKTSNSNPEWSSLKPSVFVFFNQGTSTAQFMYENHKDELVLFYNTKPVSVTSEKLSQTIFHLSTTRTESSRTSSTASKDAAPTTNSNGATVTVTAPAAISTFPRETNRPSPSPSTTSSPGLSSGEKAGISVGSILGAALLSLIAFLIFRHIRRRRTIPTIYSDLPEMREP